MSKYGVFSGPYFPVLGLNTERYEVSLRIQSECGKIQTRKNSVFEHFSRSVNSILYKTNVCVEVEIKAIFALPHYKTDFE